MVAKKGLSSLEHARRFLGGRGGANDQSEVLITLVLTLIVCEGKWLPDKLEVNLDNCRMVSRTPHSSCKPAEESIAPPPYL